MTTKPKARKFRIRRNGSGDGGQTPRTGETPGAQPAEDGAVPDPSISDVARRRAAALAALKEGRTSRAPEQAPEETTGDAAQETPATRAGEVASPQEVRSETDIDAIRQEGLTGRQLRMARRVAQKHGLAPTSDFDAVRQLRARGIDPFKPTNMLELVVPGSAAGGAGGETGPDKAKLPARADQRLPRTTPLDQANLPSTEVNPAERRAKEIMDIQRDIARRRRRRLLLLFTRLSFFVFAPAILAGYYFYVVATPMYASKAEFLILQADNQGGSGIGGLLQGTQFATNQDAIAVQSYLQSKDAMIRLDDDMGFKAHFSQDWIDPIQRLESAPSNEEAYSLYKKYVKISYDPTEGVIRMEVSAADPAISAQFAEHLITYAEERVDELSRRKREDGMRTARESLERAKEERREAQEALVRLQEDNFVDPEGYIASLRTQISNYEVQLQEKELQLQALLDNRRPNEAKVDGVRGDIGRLSALLDELNGKMTDATTGETSLAEKAARVQMAQADLATADLFLQSALQNEKQTELEANRQVRYLTTSVNPVAAQDPTYPRKFENTVLALLILSGVYLMISLTASILREQVST
ncbi:capsular polysaccharide export inner-membrane protein,BexC/CtrB/KpsE family protein [Pseudooceanicola batsensis HTCC2597]|uniref:Capsular polysaccharide export inner-membrane protein,BexC/CtrB/KpsE family protein n=1 Tax=Pseudooceanicola batsensis (strain ATCC BAA-863 / DSM 15984 / KCTC 12145 / HTCC2597) TaxID=252305 RepID=A3TYQ8_PSEBH|nr:capsule polysaccharide transporter [Pseudooceanicola batsensis]EAQ02726.1 capsular polysaccharide export inner-membrane protein,BexC/CtrB/KpsE family protein [Pseudooceanicola batsensis HTCC2597]